MKLSYILPVFLCIGILSSCSCNDNRPLAERTGDIHIEDIDDKGEEPPVEAVKIIRLDQELIKVKSPEDIVAFDKKYPFYFKHFLGADPNNPVKPALMSQMFGFYTNKEAKEFFDLTEKQFSDISDIEGQFAQMFAYLKYYFPDFKAPKIYTTVSMQDHLDIAFTDEVIIINLGKFLGKTSDPKFWIAPTPELPQYLIDRLNRAYLVPMICQRFSFSYIKENDENRMLDAMIFFGKMHYFTERIMPDLPDSLNIMYTAVQMEEADKNKYRIYHHFSSKELFYTTDEFLITKYTGERPRVQEIGDNCPGRIGRWMGWQIVRQYMELHPEVTLQQLMEDKDTQKIFKQSKYKPKK